MADIVFVSAVIGGGKSLYATRCILEELRRSNRMIVTNVPLRMDTPAEDDGTTMTVAEWCHKYIDEPVDLRKRLRVLTREEVFEFWRYLPDRDPLPLVSQARPGKDPVEVTDLEARVELARKGEIPFGCFYVIDEVHLYFAARDWQAIGNKVEHYMSQLRKCNDDLFLITQHPEKVDKNFRRNSTQWLYLKNMSRTRLWGGVMLKGRFRYNIYPDMPQRGDKPEQSGWMQLADKEYHKCYDTMAGVGLMGKMHPESSRVKGYHWSLWVVLIVACGFGAFWVPRIVMGAVGRTIGASVVGMQRGITSKISGQGVNGVVPGSSASKPSPNVAVVAPAVSLPAEVHSVTNKHAEWAERVWMTGFMKTPQGYYVALSDGRILSSQDPRMERLTEEGVLYDGVYYTRQLLGR